MVGCSSDDFGGPDQGADASIDTGTTTTHPDSGAGADTSQPEKCSSSNCPGCCFNGTCQIGNTVAACGKGGGECSQCVTNQICGLEQSCGVDPDGSWLVQPDSATISTKNGNGDWDFGAGAPDPFVQLWCPSTASSMTSQTPTASDTFSPKWTKGGCVMKAKDLMATGYGIEVFDDDLNASDVIASKATIKPGESDLLQGSMTLSNSSTLVTLKIVLTKQ